MRTPREITAEEENFRIEDVPGTNIGIIRRDPIMPEPIGTIFIRAYRITGYNQDCDGSLMVRADEIEMDTLEETGAEIHNTGLYPSTNIVLSGDELKELHRVAALRPSDTVPNDDTADF